MNAYLEEPTPVVTDLTELLPAYLDWYRSVIDRKLAGLTEGQLHTGVLPSGWTPLELLKHLVHMERRWIRWGFLGEPVNEPWGDHDPTTERWRVGPQDTLPSLLTMLYDGGRVTREVAASHPLTAPSAVGGRFDGTGQVPTLGWILLHVLQEFSRHAGHLDAVRELLDGSTGE